MVKKRKLFFKYSEVIKMRVQININNGVITYTASKGSCIGSGSTLQNAVLALINAIRVKANHSEIPLKA